MTTLTAARGNIDLMSQDPNKLVLTTNRSGWVWVVLLAVLGVASAWDAAARGFGGLAVTVVVWMACIGWFVALIFVLPSLSMDAGGATVRNVLVQVRVPWARLKDARNTMFLEVVPDKGLPIKVWAAPQSVMRRKRQSLRNRAAMDVDVAEDPAPKGDLAAGLIVERDRALSAARKKPATTAGAVTTTFLKRDWGIFAGLLVLALVSLLLT